MIEEAPLKKQRRWKCRWSPPLQHSPYTGKAHMTAPQPEQRTHTSSTHAAGVCAAWDVFHFTPLLTKRHCVHCFISYHLKFMILCKRYKITGQNILFFLIKGPFLRDLYQLTTAPAPLSKLPCLHFIKRRTFASQSENSLSKQSSCRNCQLSLLKWLIMWVVIASHWRSQTTMRWRRLLERVSLFAVPPYQFRCQM